MRNWAHSYLMAGGFALIASGTVYAAEPVHLERPYVSVSDVVEWPHAGKVAETIMATPLFHFEDEEELSLGSDEIASALQTRIPGLSGRLKPLSSGETYRFIYRPKLSAKPEGDDCLKLLRPVEAGRPILRRDVVPSKSCEPETLSGWSYDAQRSTLGNETDLEIGARLPVRSIELLPEHVEGDELILVSVAGPVRITRPVTLMETPQGAGPVHVRTSDGRILKALMPDSNPMTEARLGETAS